MTVVLPSPASEVRYKIEHVPPGRLFRNSHTVLGITDWYSSIGWRPAQFIEELPLGVTNVGISGIADRIRSANIETIASRLTIQSHLMEVKGIMRSWSQRLLRRF